MEIENTTAELIETEVDNEEVVYERKGRGVLKAVGIALITTGIAVTAKKVYNKVFADRRIKNATKILQDNGYAVIPMVNDESVDDATIDESTAE